MTIQESQSPANPVQLAKCYGDLFADTSTQEIPLTFAAFCAHCEIEEITQEEILDVEFLRDRVDVWTEMQ